VLGNGFCAASYDVAQTSIAKSWQSLVAHLLFFGGNCLSHPQLHILPFFGKISFIDTPCRRE
jgi:hypothetical protein